jgi:hypothetical protein
MICPAIRLSVLLFLTLSSWSSSAQQQPSPTTGGSYVYCNVFASGACFGIAAGDSLTMSIPVDFVLYEVALSFGRKATIYSGYHPSTDAKSAEFKPCAQNRGFLECRSRSLPGGGFEMLALSNENSPYLHVQVSGGEGNDAALQSFIGNIRACTRSPLQVSCSP